MIQLAALLAPSGLQGLLERPPTWIQSWGYLLLFVVALELMVGYRVIKFQGIQFRKVHPALAWGLAALVAPHAVFGIAHVLMLHMVTTIGLHVHVAASPENMPIWLDAEGLVILVLIAAQIMAGNGVFKLKRPQFRSLHAMLAWMIAAFALLHAALGLAHVLSG